MSEFGDAFKAARKAGKMTFEYKGKKYGTRLANETKEQHKKKMSSQSPLSRDIMQESGKNTGYKGDLKSMPAAKRKKEEAVKVPTKAMPKVAESKPAPAKAVKKSSTAPRSGSAVSRSQREDAFIKGLKEEATAKRATADKAKKSSAANEKMIGKKPSISVTKDSREEYIAKRKKGGRKATAQDYERYKAMKEYGRDRKKVKAIADKYKGVLSRAAKMFKPGGSLKSLPEGNPGLAKLPKAVRNKMGYAKKGSKMPSYYGGGKMKK